MTYETDNLEHEKEANEYNFRCLMLTLAAVEVIWIVTEIGWFSVAKDIMRLAVIPITIIFLIVIILLVVNGFEHNWVKYLIITTEIIGIHIMGTMLTYHVTIFFGIPFLMAAHYQKKRVAHYTLLISLIGMIIVVTAGYSIGVCDLNMVAFTKERVSSYGELAIIPIYSITTATQLKVFAYFYFPRAVLLVLFEIMTQSIAESGRKMQQRKEKAEYESTHDEMTGVYNKNMYLKMIKNRYPKVKDIGVIYFDVNGLKTINDTLGHEKGDMLIRVASKTISYYQNKDNKVYRVGGDEFVMILENANEDVVEKTLSSWRKLLDNMNTEMTDFKCEVASGYAVGKGEDVDKIIKEADDRMYKNKIKMKGFAR